MCTVQFLIVNIDGREEKFPSEAMAINKMMEYNELGEYNWQLELFIS